MAKPTAVKVRAPESEDENVVRLRRRYDELKRERVNFEAHWEEIAEVIMPSAQGFVGMRTAGEKRMGRVWDGTGIHSNELLASGLHGMATNPASKWFSLRMTDDDLNDVDEVKLYLAEVEKRMWAAIYAPGTNFTTALHEAYLSLGAFGTAILFAGQRQNGGLLFNCRSLAECVIAENAEGYVDTVMRSFQYTVRQLMQLAKSEGWTPSERVKTLYEEGKIEEKIAIVHAVHPREERQYGRKDPANMAFASCYYEHEEAHRLSESGFPEFPYLAPRWAKFPGEVYGRSPGMTALPDVKMLQAMSLTTIKAGQKCADPPLWLNNDGAVGQTRTVPGGINYWRGNPNEGIMLMPTPDKLPWVEQQMEQLRNRIRATFYTDILQIVTDQDMTATEVMQRTQERMRLLGPMVGRLEAELLGPLVTRVFGILDRLGKLPEPPEDAMGHEFTVEYVSPMATAQKQSEVEGMMKVWQMIGTAFGPEVAAQIVQENQDIDATYAYVWDLYNNDPELLKTEEEKAQAQQAKQAMMAANMVGQAGQAGVPIADIAQKGAQALKTLGDTQNTAQGPQGGLDLGGFAGRMIEQVRQNPKLLAGLKGTAEQSGVLQQ